MSWFDTILQLISTYGLLGIAGSMIVENIGIPFPTEGAFLVAQQYIAHHRYTFWEMYGFMVLTQVLGAILAFWIGTLVGHLLLARAKPGSGLAKSEAKMMAWYKKYGSATVFATRLIGYVRPWSSLVAGIAQFPFLPFVWWTILGTALFVYPTMQATGLIVRLWQNYPGLHVVISVVSLLLFLGALLYGLGRKLIKKEEPSEPETPGSDQNPAH